MLSGVTFILFLLLDYLRCLMFVVVVVVFCFVWVWSVCFALSFAVACLWVCFTYFVDCSICLLSFSLLLVLLMVWHLFVCGYVVVCCGYYACLGTWVWFLVGLRGWGWCWCCGVCLVCCVCFLCWCLVILFCLLRCVDFVVCSFMVSCLLVSWCLLLCGDFCLCFVWLRFGLISVEFVWFDL